MVFNYTYRIGLEDCGRENKATNKAILTIPFSFLTPMDLSNITPARIVAPWRIGFITKSSAKNTHKIPTTIYMIFLLFSMLWIMKEMSKRRDSHSRPENPSSFQFYHTSRSYHDLHFLHTKVPYQGFFD